MADQDEREDDDSAAERRLVQARQSIGRSFDELISRVGSSAPEQVEQSGEPEPVDQEEDDDLVDPPAAQHVGGEDDDLTQSPPPVATGGGVPADVEARLTAWVNARVEAAERRLELQSKALEAALGEEAVSARRAGEQVDAAREALIRATEIALRAVGESVEGAKAELSTAASERAETSLAETETRVRGLGSVLQDELRDTIVGSNQETLERAVGEATQRVRNEVELALREAREHRSG